MSAAKLPKILLVVAKQGHEQGLLKHLEGLGEVATLYHPTSEKLGQIMKKLQPRLLICEQDRHNLSVRTITAMIRELDLRTRVLVLAPSRDADATIRAMSQGARDLVGEADPLHLQLVVARELGVLEEWCERNAARLAPFVEDEGQATLDGARITACNAALASRLGAASPKAVEGTSILKYINGDDHPVVKQLIKSCLEGEGTITPVSVRVNRVDGTQARVLVAVKAAYQDDRVTLTLTMKPDSGAAEGRAEPAAAVSRSADPAIHARIEKAVKQNKLALMVQPISDLVGEPEKPPSSKLDVYVMIKDDEGELPASKFIPEARASGLIRYIDRWVIHNACASLHKNLASKGPVTLFLRLSRQTLHDPLLLAILKRAAHEHAVNPGCLALELVEDDVAAFTPDEYKVLHDIKGAGFLLSISHFGGGAESREVLERVAADFVKLAPKLVQKVQDSDKSRQLIQELVAHAHARQAGVVATAVPNATAMATLWGLGVHYVQGNYLQEPIVIGS